MTSDAFCRPSKKHLLRSYGVVSTFVFLTAPSVMMQISVSVPPLSMLICTAIPHYLPPSIRGSRLLLRRSEIDTDASRHRVCLAAHDRRGVRRPAWIS